MQKDVAHLNGRSRDRPFLIAYAQALRIYSARRLVAAPRMIRHILSAVWIIKLRLSGRRTGAESISTDGAIIAAFLTSKRSAIRAASPMQNTLFYGDNLDILREYIRDESVDFVYLDPPFNSAQRECQESDAVGELRSPARRTERHALSRAESRSARSIGG